MFPKVFSMKGIMKQVFSPQSILNTAGSVIKNIKLHKLKTSQNLDLHSSSFSQK